MPLMPIEDLFVRVDSKYRLVHVAAKRAKQLMRGSPPLLHPRSHKPSYISLEELATGKLNYEAEAPAEELGRELAAEEAKPLWFRNLAPEIIAEEPAVEEAEAGEEAEVVEELVEAPGEVGELAEEEEEESEVEGLTEVEPLDEEVPPAVE